MPTFLVVDHSAVDRKQAGAVLEKLEDATVCYFGNAMTALEQLPLLRPDLIVSEIDLPELDGWELLREVHRRYPRLPVIFVTGRGCEDTAMRAMESNSAGYVPKRRLISDLATTVERVLSQTLLERQSARLIRRLDQQELTFILENNTSELVALAAHLRESVRSHWQCDEVHLLRIGMAIEEALINACYHGNLELSSSLRDQDDDVYRQLARERTLQAPYAQRRVTVQFHCGPRSLHCTIRDDGPGFDPHSLPDPFSEGSLTRPSGRGLTLIRSFMDEVRFNDQGNEITLFKRRPPLPKRVLNSDELAMAGR